MRQGRNKNRNRGPHGGHGGHQGGGGGGHSSGGGNPNRRPNVPSRNQAFDSNGPEGRIRGTAYQIYERYLTLARDAASAGDRIRSESCLQHAEHYFRIIAAMEANDPRRQGQGPQPGGGMNGANGHPSYAGMREGFAGEGGESTETETTAERNDDMADL